MANLFRDYTDEQIKKIGDDAFNRLVIKETPSWWGEGYDPDKYHWNPTPPEDGTCRDCYEWRRYGTGQRHFGFQWWSICDRETCPHEHHKHEVGIG